MGIFDAHFTPISEGADYVKALDEIGADFAVRKEGIFFRPDEVVEVAEAAIREAFEKGDLEAALAAFESSCIRVPYYSTIAREDNWESLGVGSSNYGLVQYLDAVACTSEIADEARFVRGRVQGKGERLYLVMTDDQEIDLGEGLVIRNYFTISTSHDGSLAFEISPTPVLVETGEVFTFNQSGKVWTKHSKHVDKHVGSLRTRLGKIRDFWTQFGEDLTLMSSTSITTQQFETFLEGLIPGDSTRAVNIRDKVSSIYNGGAQRAHPALNGTVLGAYFAVVTYCEREKTVRASDKLDKASCEVRASLDGEAAKQKAEAFASFLTLAKKLEVE